MAARGVGARGTRRALQRAEPRDTLRGSQDKHPDTLGQPDKKPSQGIMLVEAQTCWRGGFLSAVQPQDVDKPLMHGVVPQMCRQGARPTLDGLLLLELYY